MHTTSVREPAVAGLFYPKDARVLASTVDSLLGARAEAGSSVRVMVVPHAGYAYSGLIAARAFEWIARQSLKTNQGATSSQSEDDVPF